MNQPLPLHLDDVALMRLITEGNTDALALLYDRHASLIYSVLMQKLEDPAEAQDIVHDVFVKLHTKSNLYSPALEKPVAWLLTVARNAATDNLRKRSTHQKYVKKPCWRLNQALQPIRGPMGMNWNCSGIAWQFYPINNKTFCNSPTLVG